MFIGQYTHYTLSQYPPPATNLSLLPQAAAAAPHQWLKATGCPTGGLLLQLASITAYD